MTPFDWLLLAIFYVAPHHVFICRRIAAGKEQLPKPGAWTVINFILFDLTCPPIVIAIGLLGRKSL